MQLQLRAAASQPNANSPFVSSRRTSLAPLRTTRTKAISAATMTLAPLLFTPEVAAIGGLTLGAATIAKYCLTGRILGISGTVKGLVTGDAAPWRVAFTAGLLSAGALALRFMPAAFDALPATYTMARAITAGALVGFGAAMGNGCTSGHGICGNSRLSLRSTAATCTFMATGMATATLAGSLQGSGLAAAAGSATGAVPYAAISAAALQQGLGLLAASVLALSGTYCAAHALVARDSDKPGRSLLRQGLELASEAASGLVFGLGLAFSGMLRPSKVLAFLSLAGKSAAGALVPLARWDPSLVFVMGGALLVTLPAFQLIARGRVLPRPLLGGKFGCPASSAIDRRLITGAALFGAGWGVGGMCPGPALVALMAGDPQVLAFVLAMLAGMGAEKVLAENATFAAMTR